MGSERITAGGLGAPHSVRASQSAPQLSKTMPAQRIWVSCAGAFWFEQ
ncbi:MAG: hypothetical protein P8077_07230 [Gammaproteobacteria bacterium]